MTQGTTLRLIPALLAIAFSGTAAASGFQLMEQNAAGVGTAFAGAAATAEDASTIYFNPAGMTYLSEGHNVTAAGTLLDRRTHFTDEGTSRMPIINNPVQNQVVGQYQLGDSGGNGGGLHVIPAFYYAYSLTPSWRVGISVNPTFADETKYGNNFIGRFSGLQTTIHQININPSVAYKVNEQLSLGFGVNYAYNEVKFKQNTPYTGSPMGTLKGDDGAWGYNFGVLYQITPDTRVGVSYRSKIKFHLEGHQTVDGLINHRDIKANFESPDTASVALQHRLNDRWTVLADYTWTGWSSLQALSPVYTSNGARATAPLRYNFKDTYRVGVGATYQLNNEWKLRFGTAYDKNPIPDDASRTMTVPDADRIWLAFGARWTLSPKTSVDLGYAHLFVKDSNTARAVKNTAETATLQTVRGKFENSADMISAQVNFNF